MHYITFTAVLVFINVQRFVWQYLVFFVSPSIVIWKCSCYYLKPDFCKTISTRSPVLSTTSLSKYIQELSLTLELSKWCFNIRNLSSSLLCSFSHTVEKKKISVLSFWVNREHLQFISKSIQHCPLVVWWAIIHSSMKCSLVWTAGV